MALHLADEIAPTGKVTEEALSEIGLPPELRKASGKVAVATA